jgi:hypothetical protein
MQTWSLLATVVLWSAACSSSTSGTPAAGASQDASSPEGSAEASADGRVDGQADSGAPSGEASTDDAGSVTDAGEAGTTQPGDGGGTGVNACAACTVQVCMAQLQGCAASQACLDALQGFNACYGASPDAGAVCGAMLAASGPEGATLWQCLSTSCTSACG